MDTQTGRIYELVEMQERVAAMETRRALDDHQAEFERAHRAGRIVAVSAEVARQVRTGQRVDERRRKRKAARAARKKNR